MPVIAKLQPFYAFKRSRTLLASIAQKSEVETLENGQKVHSAFTKVIDLEASNEADGCATVQETGLQLWSIDSLDCH